MAYRAPLAPPVLRALAFVLILGCVLLSPIQLWAKGCAESVIPAAPPPQSLWSGSSFEPSTILLDATRWTGSQLPNTSFPISTSVDIENGWVFHSFYGGFSIWDARTNPAAPTRAAQIGGFEGSFPGWPRVGEFTQVVFYIDAPEGNDNLAAIAAISPLGLTIWDTTNKTAPRELYQDASKFMYQVYAARIGGRDYAFGGDFVGNTGLHAYDMTAARSFTSPCADVGGNCPGVYLGRIGAAEAIKYVSGLGVGNRHFVATSGGDSSGTGISIWEVTNPSQPSLVVRDFHGFAQYGSTHGVALWTQNGQHYLAARHSKGSQDIGKIFNITSCLTTGCSGLQNLEVWRSAQPLKPYPESTYWLSAIFSRSGTTPFVYFGNHDTCRQGEADFHTEYLYDVSNPANPVDISPDRHITDEGRQVDYWSWYYSDTTRGWSHFGPRVAKFNGQYLYRAAATIFDVHKWTGASTSGPPVANFDWSPGTIYAGDPVSFASTSTGAPTGFSWIFPDGSPSSSTANAAQVTFSSPGVKSVSLTVTKGTDTSTKTQNVTVLDPAPTVGSITVSPQNPLACQPVTLTANGLGGKPPVSVSWTVSNGPLVVATGTTSPSFTWDSAGSPAGLYTANVLVSKPGYPSASASTQVTLGTLPALPTSGSFTPTYEPPPGGTVQFHVNAPGATKWTWDFGDGTVQTFTDPVTGPNPTHAYRVANTYPVKVSVSNCLSAQVVQSGSLSVVVTQVEPLAVTQFQAQGCQIFCDFTPGQAITFTTEATGSPTSYEYDWSGNGFGGANVAAAQTSSTPVTSHTYAAQGTYSPALRLRRGTEVSAVWTHLPISIHPATTNPPPPPTSPSVTVSGPSSGQINTAYTFTATAANCTPGTWTWAGGSGATITGSGISVSITWSSTGSKTVTATATGCTSGSKSITINGPSDPPPNTGGLTADFTFSPTTPQANQVVSFNASSSTGNPITYFWEFQDGTNAYGVTVTRAFPVGSQNVKLTVYKDCASGSCSSSASVTKTVVVGGAPSVVAGFDTSATCTSDITGVSCQAPTGQAVTFTSTSTGNPTSFTWNFGDGTPAGNGAQASHTWSSPGNYTVQLTVGNGTTTASATRTFVVAGAPIAQTRSVVLPWIAQTRGALVQSSDLYVHNPGTTPMDITLEFRKRGVPESNPPRAPRTIQPGATLYVGDVLRDLFNREGVAGFIVVTVDRGDAEPVITSFNTTFQADGKTFGQTVAGVSMSSAGSAAGSGPENRMQHLVGLIDNTERLAYFGLSNPTDQPATYHLRFFDKTGRQIGESAQDLTLSRFGQRQFQVREVEELFGVSNVADYRIEIEKKTGSMIVPYASNLRLSSEDPSFIEAGSSKNAKSYLLGTLSAPGLNNSTWQTDLLLTNVNTQAVTAQVTFTAVGLNSLPTTPVSITLQPGQTERLENVIASRWNIRNAVGVLTITSTSPNGVFPIVQGESYESTNTDPAKRFGQSMTALSDSDAAGIGKSQYLVGLRQDAKNRTTMWIYNPDAVTAEYEISYLGLDGRPIAPVSIVRLGAGKMRQFSPSQHPLPAAGVANGFAVQIKVKSGKVLSSAQVINNVTNDPAYIQGEVR